MRLAVFCNNGNMEQGFLERALRHGYEVQAVVPAQGRLRIGHDRLAVVQGAPDDPAVLEKTLTGAHAVVSLPGAIASQASLKTVVAGMQAYGIMRFIVATGSLAEAQPEGFADILKRANLDWTVVHIAGENPAQDIPAPFNVSGMDFAKYLLGQVTDVTHIGAAVLLRN